MCMSIGLRFVFFVISEEKTFRAVRDFDPKHIKHSDRIELDHSLHRKGRVSARSYNPADKVDPFADAIPFKRGDQMKTIRPANIG